MGSSDPRVLGSFALAHPCTSIASPSHTHLLRDVCPLSPLTYTPSPPHIPLTHTLPHRTRHFQAFAKGHSTELTWDFFKKMWDNARSVAPPASCCTLGHTPDYSRKYTQSSRIPISHYATNPPSRRPTVHPLCSPQPRCRRGWRVVSRGAAQ